MKRVTTFEQRGPRRGMVRRAGWLIAWFVPLLALCQDLLAQEMISGREVQGSLGAKPLAGTVSPVPLLPADPQGIESQLKALEQIDPARAAEIRKALRQAETQKLRGGQETLRKEVEAKETTETKTPSAAKEPAKKAGEKLTREEEEGKPEGPSATQAEQARSAIEMLFAQGVVAEESPALVQFGYDLFQQGEQASFVPAGGALVGPDYVLGPGDEFTVTLWGMVEGTYTVRVSREGTVMFPRVGEVLIAGTPYGDLKKLLEQAFAKQYKNFHLSVTMGELRGIQVFLVGEVQRPGSYKLSSLATVFNALFVCGGPKKSGTLRDIRVVRNGKVVKHLDLYDFLLNGDKSQDFRLQDQDTVFIPLIGPVVAVSGQVNRPAIYELKGHSTLKDVLALAGRVRPTGYLARVQIERVRAHQEKTALDLDLRADWAQGIPVQNLDLIKVFPINPLMQEVVYLKGHVVRPGPYQFRPGMRVRGLVTSWQDLLPGAYPDYAQLLRFAPLSAGVSLDGSTRMVIPVNLRKVLEGDEAANLPLENLDELTVFATEDLKARPSVAVLGEVRNPGRFPLFGEMRVSDLLFLGGGLTEQASRGGAELTRYRLRDSTTVLETVTVDLSKALAGDPTHNVLLKEFDTLVVRPIPESAIGWAVELKGEVKHPGVYMIQRGERLSSVLRRAGGLTPRAYPKGAIFIRESVKKAQQEHLHKLSALHNLRLSTESTALALGGLDKPQAEAQKELVAALRTVPEQLAQQVTLGRMVVRVDSPEKLEGTPDDLVLEPGDSLEIPPVPLTVSVLGNVRHPTALLYREGEEAMSYVRQAGGLTPDADWENAYLIKADGSAVALSGGSLSNHLDPAAEGLARIEPGDAIVVPPKVEVRTRPAPTWQAVPDYTEAGTEASRGKGR